VGRCTAISPLPPALFRGGVVEKRRKALPRKNEVEKNAPLGPRLLPSPGPRLVTRLEKVERLADRIADVDARIAALEAAIAKLTARIRRLEGAKFGQRSGACGMLMSLPNYQER
jgi:hypothetical protein